jgi:serine/threonine protein kinase/DNA-binding SARP family transcriptional activator
MHTAMDTPLPDRAASLLEAALELPPAERETYLAAACGEDAPLLAEVQALLAAHESAPTVFLGAPAADGISGGGLDALLASGATGSAPADGTFTEQEGDVIGPYTLRQQIGEGGFGTVWMAEQSVPISRMVALKVIKAGMDTKQVLARFEAERQALAMMDHPNIAKVLDAGATPTGRPWFAMELVKGIPITQFCDEQGLGTKERLELFGDVCAAVNHAHQKGIIHRDLKPSNVMVTLHGDKAVVKVIDFGIAKATQGKLTDKTLFTRYEQFIGTPVYMSPEQASLSGLDIDTRSDIYALGVLLYELLTGKPPFDGKSLISAGYEEMRRIIREEEPPKPSSRLSTMASEERTKFARARRIEESKLNRLVAPDLDWIVMKAIEKDRARRYETANAFAQDIGRFLADEPVSASPPSTGYRFRKFALRNKGTLRVAAIIVLLLVAATAVSTWKAVRATRAEKRTAETLEEVAAERDAKEKALGEAEAVTAFLTETFQSPDPARDGRTITVAETLGKAAEKLNSELADQPVRRAKLQATLGGTFFSLGLYQEAVPLEEKAYRSYLDSLGPEHPETLGTMTNLARSYRFSGRRDEALELQERALSLKRRVLPPNHPYLAIAMNNMANLYLRAGRRDEARKLYEEVLPLSRQALGPEHPVTLDIMSDMANALDADGRKDEALKLRDEVLPLCRKVLGPEHPDTLKAMSDLANSYHDAGRMDEFLEMLKEVQALSLKVLGPEHPDTLNAMAELADSYDDTGRRDEALKLLEEVVALHRKVLGPEHPTTLMAMNSLANS